MAAVNTRKVEEMFNFVNMPPELRIDIYEHHFDDGAASASGHVYDQLFEDGGGSGVVLVEARRRLSAKRSQAGYAFQSVNVLDRCNNVPYAYGCLAIFLTNREIHGEAVPVLYTPVEFRVKVDSQTLLLG
jgi:hypothetical protein